MENETYDLTENTNKNGSGGIRIVRVLLTSALCVASAAGFFYGGYRIGTSTVAAPAAVEEKHPPAVSEADSVRYTVKAENGRLCLYESDTGGQRLLSSQEISIEVFPAADAGMLKEGVEFTDRMDAQALFEDFSN